MRIIIFSLITLFLFSCQSNEKTNISHTDSLLTQIDTVKDSNTSFLDDLLLIKNETELKQTFGSNNVTFDTIWGAEGLFSMGTKLFNNSPDEVIIIWADTLNNSNIYSVGIHCYYGINSDTTILGKKWKTKLGITLGTTLKELVLLNEKSFSFSGLGWDYGGSVSNWNNGKLEKAGISVTLDVSANDIMSKEYDKIIGDIQISSSDPNAIKVNPFVRELYLTNNK